MDEAETREEVDEDAVELRYCICGSFDGGSFTDDDADAAEEEVDVDTSDDNEDCCDIDNAGVPPPRRGISWTEEEGEVF